MKLRIKGNSLRLRLTQGEVTQLARAGRVSERVSFPGGVGLEYCLETDTKVEEISAIYDNNRISIRVPAAAARAWQGSDTVTLERDQPLGTQSLRIILEKDFACLAPRAGEDESDHFPHPASGTGKTC